MELVSNLFNSLTSTVIWFVGLLITLGVFQHYIVNPLLSSPAIEIQAGGEVDAFSLYFSIYNSTSATMRDANWVFYIHHADFGRGNIMKDTVLNQGSFAAINPGKTVQFKCPIIAKVQEAKISVKVTYKTWGLLTRKVTEEFTWQPSKNQWLKGAVLD